MRKQIHYSSELYYLGFLSPEDVVYTIKKEITNQIFIFIFMLS